MARERDCEAENPGWGPGILSHSALSPHPLTRTALILSPSVWVLAVAAGTVALAGFLVPDPEIGLLLAAVATTLASLVVLIRWLSGRHARTRARLQENIAAFVTHDAAPSFTTDADGQIDYQNRAAQKRFGACSGQTLLNALGDLFASPSAVLYRLQSRAAAVGAAREDVVTRSGHVRLAVHRIDGGGFLWRLEEMMDRSATGRGAETLSLPMLTASRKGTILFMNEALRQVLGGRVRRLDQVVTQPLHSGETVELRGAGGPVRAIAADLEDASGRREIYFLPLGSGEAPATLDARTGAMENVPVALMRVRSDGTVYEANRQARELLRLDGDELSSDPPVLMSDLVEGLGRPVCDWLADAESGRVLNKPEVLHATRPERETFLQITLRREADDGPGGGLCAVLYDATEFKSLEAQFVQSQKMQAIGQLAGGVAHDFNNLLTAIAGHCDLLLLRHDKGDPDYADLVQIHQNANRAGSLVSQLLAFSRKQTLKPEVVDLGDALGDLTHLLNRLVGEKVSLALDLPHDLAPIRADRRQLEQVVMNLVVNARDAMTEGGVIRIETEPLTLEEDMRRDRAVVPRGEYVVVHVQDEGEGMTDDQLAKIFEPFYTTKRPGEGTGLGLSTAYGIMKQTGGFIFADSTPGEGSTFSLFFTALDRATVEEQTRAHPAPGTVRRGDGVILLVEDEAPVRAFASRALRMRGYTVLEAATAEEALETLSDPELEVDLFVTDVIMPGMDGPSWVKEALKERPQAKVIFVSGYAEDPFAGTQAHIPNSVFLPKPFSLGELTTIVQDQMQ
ncbi:hybrid sensor histidine kinase/response regulator [Rhodobacteraceae bacterium WD3A24]|nr:hybrid sensor histidine kinase/response regulator [Rhodobacteraceae bacterium WD3A24]